MLLFLHKFYSYTNAGTTFHNSSKDGTVGREAIAPSHSSASNILHSFFEKKILNGTKFTTESRYSNY